MKQWMLLLWSVLVMACGPRLNAQVTLSSAVNSASYLNATLPNGSLAQGSIFIAFGKNLGPAKLGQISAFPLPTTLSGTSISATVNGTTVQCIMLYTTATQVAAVLPSNTPVGTGTMVATYNGTSSTPLAITVAAHAFGIYAVNQGGSGAGVLTNAVTNVVNSSTAAANPGDLVDIWGTGLGPVNGNEAGGPLPGDMPSLGVQVLVGGQSAQVMYSGRSGCCTGLDQIEIQVPTGISGCTVPVYILVGGVVSNFVTMSIAESGSTCSDPNGYTSSQLQTAQANGGLRIGSASIAHLQGITKTTSSNGDSVAMVFEKVNLSGLQYSTPLPKANTCYVVQFPVSFAVPATSPLQAGGVTLSGPVGPYPLAMPQPGEYSLAFQPNTLISNTSSLITDGTVLKPGTYTFAVAGGSDVSAFSTTVPLPTPLQWTNRPNVPATVPRNQGLTINWSNGYAGALLTIEGQSQVSLGVGAQFMCWADATDTSFTVPAAILSALPPTYSNQGNPQGSLDVYEVYTGQFTAPGIDVGSTQFSDGFDIAPVAYQ